MTKRKHSIRRFVHANGGWANFAVTEGQVVRFSGKKNNTVPYFCGVTEKVFTPRSTEEELERRVAEFVRRNYHEILSTRRPAGETRIDGLWRRFENWLL